MEKRLILQKMKEQIAESDGSNKEILNLRESDIELGEEHQMYCRVYQYTCTGAGQKFAGDLRFPLTKTYKSDAKWFCEGDASLAERFLINYVGGKKQLEELGGCYTKGDLYEALRSDAFWKLREDFRMYDCRVLPESIRVDDFEEISTSSPVFRTIYRSDDPEKTPIGYIARHAYGEVVLLEKNKNNNSSESGNGVNPNWFLIIAGIFCPPILIVYIIYLMSQKK